MSRLRCASACVICGDKRNNGEVYKQRVREQSQLSASDEQDIGLANRKQKAIIISASDEREWSNKQKAENNNN